MSLLILRMLVVLLLSFGADALRQRRSLVDRAKKASAEELHEKANYTVTFHKRIAREVAQELSREHTDLYAIFGTAFAEQLAKGAAWPDCPVMLDDFKKRLNVEMESAYDSCVDVPGAGEIGFHEGLSEMGVQLLKQNIPLLGSMRIKERMGNNRMLMQHQHASPLPTTHLVYEDEECGPTCQTALRQNCLQSRIDPQAHFCDLPPFADSFLGSDFHFSQVHAIPHALSTNQQVRNKILEQSGKWYCKAMQHSVTALLLERDWDWEARKEEADHEFYTMNHWNLTGDESGWQTHLDPWGNWAAEAIHILFNQENWDNSDDFIEYESRSSVRFTSNFSTLGGHMESMWKFWERERKLGIHFLGRILHPLQDSYSRSHAMRQWGTGEVPEILQYYTMDDVDWRKHGNYDKVEDDMLRAAKDGTSHVVEGFYHWIKEVKAKIWKVGHAKTSIIDDIGGAGLFNDGLRDFLRTLCIFLKMDNTRLREPAGGSAHFLSLSRRSWKPEAMPENLAEEYRHYRQVYDYPPDEDICTARELYDDDPGPGDYRRMTKSPSFILGGDGLGVGRDTEIALTCKGLGASSTITLQQLKDKQSLKAGDDGIMKLQATNLAWWQLYTE